MQKSVRYYIQSAGESPVVRSVAVDKPAEASALRPEPVPGSARQVQPSTQPQPMSGVRRIRAAIKRGGL